MGRLALVGAALMKGGQIAALIFAVFLLLPGSCFLWVGIHGKFRKLPRRGLLAAHRRGRHLVASCAAVLDRLQPPLAPLNL